MDISKQTFNGQFIYNPLFINVNKCRTKGFKQIKEIKIFTNHITLLFFFVKEDVSNLVINDLLINGYINESMEKNKMRRDEINGTYVQQDLK